jgi:hypothetical protein
MLGFFGQLAAIGADVYKSTQTPTTPKAPVSASPVSASTKVGGFPLWAVIGVGVAAVLAIVFALRGK